MKSNSLQQLRAMAERIFVISDIHIGHPNFVNETHLNSFLDHVMEDGKELIINGDLLDFQQSTTEKLLMDFDTVLGKLLQLIQKGIKVTYVIGNHDIRLSNFIIDSDIGIETVYPIYLIEMGGDRIHIEHGHLFDQAYQKIPRLYNWGSRFLGFLMRFKPDLGDDLGSLYRYFESRIYSLSKTPGTSGKYQGDLNEYQKGAKNILEGQLSKKDFIFDGLQRKHRDFKGQKPVDVVIFGHTHFELLKELSPGKTYVNSGTWLKKSTYVEIVDDDKYEGLKIHLRDWEKVRASLPT